MRDSSLQTTSTLFPGDDLQAESELYKCVHCGFCLEACPTYSETRLETESPRGRIALMKAANDGRIDITPQVARHWDLCIQCRACEVACPSDVPYGRLIEATMVKVHAQRKLSLVTKLISDFFLKQMLPRQNRLALLVLVLRLYQRSGIQSVIRKTGILRLVSSKLAEIEESMPVIPSTFFAARGQTIRAHGEKKARVALLSGCLMSLLHGPQMEAVVRVLSYNGCEVVVPSEQVCCGALNTHVGDLETARGLAKSNIDAFFESDVDAIIVASAGCGTRMKEYNHLLQNDAQFMEKSNRFSHMVKDIHEFLVSLPFKQPTTTLNCRVTYQDPCHLSNTQGITKEPRELLASIPGLQLVELNDANKCCGGGGTYTLTERELSLDILKSKMNSVKNTDAEIIATGNPGCVLQLQYGALKEDSTVKVCYVTDLLDQAYKLETK